MVQSLRLRINSTLSGAVLEEIQASINPKSLKAEMQKRGIANVYCDCGSSRYDLTRPYARIPTKDLTLQIVGNDFYGSASGEDQRSKLIVKAVALRSIQGILDAHAISSRMSFFDVDPTNYAILSIYGLTRKS